MTKVLSVLAIVSVVFALIETVMGLRAYLRKDFDAETRWRLRSLSSCTTAILLLVIYQRLISL